MPCLGKLLTSAKTRFRLRNVVARQRAFFDGAPLKFSLLPHFTRGEVPWQIACFGKNASLFTKRSRKTTSVFRRRATYFSAAHPILRAAACHTVPFFRNFSQKSSFFSKNKVFLCTKKTGHASCLFFIFYSNNFPCHILWV